MVVMVLEVENWNLMSGSGFGRVLGMCGMVVILWCIRVVKLGGRVGVLY